jgi:hypothetical protein
MPILHLLKVNLGPLSPTKPLSHQKRDNKPEIVDKGFNTNYHYFLVLCNKYMIYFSLSFKIHIMVIILLKVKNLKQQKRMRV